MHAMLEDLLNGCMTKANAMQGELDASIRIGSVEVYRSIYAVDE